MRPLVTTETRTKSKTVALIEFNDGAGESNSIESHVKWLDLITEMEMAISAHRITTKWEHVTLITFNAVSNGARNPYIITYLGIIQV